MRQTGKSDATSKPTKNILTPNLLSQKCNFVSIVLIKMNCDIYSHVENFGWALRK